MIIVAPWAKITNEGLLSPKNYPHWDLVVQKLAKMGLEIWQISMAGEQSVAGVHKRLDNLPFKEVESLLRECETWMSVDSFLPHLAWSVGKPGVAIFGPSDPIIFGHPENTNLLKNRKYLREQQFWWWSQCKLNLDAFVGPQEVVDAVLQSIPIRGQWSA